jgi:hypothetical protein
VALRTGLLWLGRAVGMPPGGAAVVCIINDAYGTMIDAIRLSMPLASLVMPLVSEPRLSLGLPALSWSGPKPYWRNDPASACRQSNGSNLAMASYLPTTIRWWHWSAP